MPRADFIFLHGQSLPQCDHRIDKHFTGYYTLQYMSAGSVELQSGSKAYLLSGRWFWSAYPGQRIGFHTASPNRTWRHRYVAFRGPRVQRWIDAGLYPIAPQQPPMAAGVGEQFDRMLGLFLSNDRLGLLRAVHLLEGLLLDLAEARLQDTARPDWLDTVMGRLQSAVENTEVDYGRMCSELGFSESTLRRQFKQATGLSPHEYLIQARVMRARRMLAESDQPLKAIASAVGYSDVFYFARQFRQVTGLPPAAYRRSIERP